MVEHKVRVFFEPDTDAIGAEVKIYSEEGDEIDNILITTESKWKELDDKINNMDANYVDREELLTILRNVSEELTEINASTVGGYSADQLAKLNHNELHTSYFAPINHALETSRYGLGSSTQYGHVKLIDNLTMNAFNNGEALSARQGKVLNDSIEAINALLNPKTNVIPYTKMYQNPTTGVYRFDAQSEITVTKIGKLVIGYFLIRAGVDFIVDNDYHVTTLPAEYHPAYGVAHDFSHYQHNDRAGRIAVNTDGSIKIRSNNKRPVAMVCMAWVTN